MESRYHMSTGIQMVEFPCNQEGLKQIKQFRKDNPQFARRHIKSIIQAYPSEIEIGKIYQRIESNYGRS